MDSKQRKQRKQHVLVAIGLVVAVSLWMLSGLGSEPQSARKEEVAGGSGPATGLPQVRVALHEASEISREVQLSGRTEPDRRVELRAEAEGRVARIDVERGQLVKGGTTLLVLDARDREARLAEAASLVKLREIEFEAIQNLRGRQFTTDIQIAEARAQLESARAAHERIKLEIANSTIRAPFDGVLQERMVEVGDFIRVGDSVAEFVDLDPLIISAAVNEREIGHIVVGGSGSAVLVDGTELEGTIRYVSRVAEAATRTFPVELAVPNPEQRLLAGVTAQLRLFSDAVRVHTLSSALLSLADDGTVGVKVVDDRDIVRFHPVEIAGSSAAGLHVTGLPERIRLITVGQGFVTEGQQVQAQLQDSQGQRP